MDTGVLLLDFYGTVVHDDSSTLGGIVDEVAAAIDGPRSITEAVAAHWWREFTAMTAQSVGDAFSTQAELAEASLAQTLTAFRCDLAADELIGPLHDFWRRPPLFEDSAAFLADCPVPFCIVSNIDRTEIEDAISNHGLPIENLVTSEDVRAYKPEVAIFQAALDLLEAQPDDAIHAGDSLSSDVLGAQAAGLRTIWVDRDGRTPDPTVQPTWTVSSLADLGRQLVPRRW